MSTAFEELVERAVTDDAFAVRLKDDFDGTIAEFDITDEEREAILSPDPSRLRELGLDERISKKYYAA